MLSLLCLVNFEIVSQIASFRHLRKNNYQKIFAQWICQNMNVTLNLTDQPVKVHRNENTPI